MVPHSCQSLVSESLILRFLAFITQAARRARVEAVSEAVRFEANRFYKKKGAPDTPAPSGGTISRAYKAHPIVYMPL